VEKVDLGTAWRDFTGLPFVYAAWAGPAEELGPAHLEALRAARDAGVAAIDLIAREYACGDAAREASVTSYLRDNLRYTFGDRERAGLERFWALAVDVGHAPRVLPVRCFR
jgi:chorismate dehydratase